MKIRKRILDIGCGNKKVPGALGIDVVKLPGVDIVHNLNTFPWPVKKDYFDEIHCYHYLEHCDNLIKTMEEIHRVLKKNGKVIIRGPHYSGILAWLDPTHKRAFALDTFNYFSRSSELGYYSRANFSVVKKRIKYELHWGNDKWYEKNIRSNKYSLIQNLFIGFVQKFIDSFPRIYERFFVYMTGGADEVYYELKKN